VSLSDDEAATVRRLSGQLTRDGKRFVELDAYYTGVQRLEQLGLAIPAELERFVTIVGWPAMAADGIEERLDVEGFRFPGSDEADDALWAVWQDNDLDEESQLGHLDALVYGRSYLAVGSRDPDDGEQMDSPLVTVESPREVVHEADARTRRVTAALRLYDTLESGRTVKRATLYLPDVTVWLERQRGRWVDVDRDEHDLGLVPVVPMLNRSRVAARTGCSEMDPVMSLTDAAARALTNLQVAQETHAVPQRGVLGATKGDFIDADGKALTTWEAYFGAVWALENADAKTFQFSASDLRNFETVISLYARLASGVSALPPNYFGLQADDAASADAIRSREARLVKRCERKVRAFSGAWERAMRLVLRLRDGGWDPQAKRLETLWRDPATPTRAQQADAVVKLVQAGVLPREGAWEDLGYSATRRMRLAQQFAEQDCLDPVGALTRAVGQQTPAEPVPV
jgi:hypothetical protein